MVNLGASKGCQTCRRRKVKCDQAKPTCKRCASSKLECGGYKKGNASIRFKDQTQATEQRWQGQTTALTAQRRPAARPTLMPFEDGERVAICFFLRNLATTGRGLDSARDFLECVQPCLASASESSAVARAVAAVALRLSVAWRRIPDDTLHQRRVSEALEALRVALQDPVESKSTGTLMATVLLQFHENLRAVRWVKKAERTHQDGALALIRHRGLDNFQTDVARHLLLYVRHAQISSAVREKRCVPDDLSIWQLPSELPQNPSAELDTLGISVASVQHHFLCSMGYHALCSDHQCTYEERSMINILDKAQDSDGSLVAWTEDVPDHWRPRRLEPVVEVQPPIVLYQGVCEIYASIQVASIWNSYRYNRLLMLKVLLTGMSESMLSEQPKILANQRRDRTMSNLSESVQELVDAICHSVPFYLGNREELNPLEDLDGQGIELPGYHSLDREMIAAIAKTGKVLSRVDHTRHAVVQGAWHMTSILSQLANLLSDETGYQLARILPSDQLMWIRRQLVRAAALAGVRRERLPSPPRYSPVPQDTSTSPGERDLAERLGESLRLGAVN